MKAAIIDYGAGNLKNVKTALEELGIECVITDKKEDLETADLMVLPGVGAFGQAMQNLKKTGLIGPIRENLKNKPLLGICLGMQMLFDKSYELGETEGLGLIPGEVVPFIKEELREGSKIPHMGWNQMHINKDHPIIKDLNDGDYVYFVHSYYARPKDFDDVVTWADYTKKVPAIVAKGNVIGCQFHPEKSAQVGRKILENLKEML